MDPDETYRLLCEAMEELRAADERAGGMLRKVSEAVEHWDALDGWMTRGAFPPKAWQVRVAECGAQPIEPQLSGAQEEAVTVCQQLCPLQGCKDGTRRCTYA